MFGVGEGTGPSMETVGGMLCAGLNIASDQKALDIMDY